MTHGRLITLAALIALATSACSRNTAPTAAPTAAPTVSAPADTAATTPPPADAPTPDGRPSIATEPDGVHIGYRIYGKADPAIVLIHGWATDSNYWNAQFEPLKEKYTVVAVDLAGHGASTKSRTNWSMENYGEDVAVVARLVSNPQIILVGHSM
ncbi:MAG: alpha/beta hydrolase, partial [Sinobacteraceae bacterium]|nr:alpha/beta hydrolase [Nevskiaceae bacterium]